MTDRPPVAGASRFRGAFVGALLALALGACVSAGRDGPPDHLWVRASPPQALRSAPDGPLVRGFEVVPYLGWEPVLKFTRGQPEHGPIVYVAPAARYDEHGIPRTFGKRPRPSTYVPTGRTAEDADGVWAEHVRTTTER